MGLAPRSGGSVEYIGSGGPTVGGVGISIVLGLPGHSQTFLRSAGRVGRVGLNDGPFVVGLGRGAVRRVRRR